MLRALTAILLFAFIFSACTQRMICPAYQSAFIYDKDALRKKFSYFQQDSTPKIYSASKTKFLIAEPTSYHKKIRSLQTVPMKPVNVAVPDSFKIDEEGLLGEDAIAGEDGVDPGSELDLAARSVVDSTFIVDVPKGDSIQAQEDSVYVISVDKEVRVLKYDFPDSLILDSISGKYVSETPRYAVVHVTFNVDQDNYMWYLRDYLVLPDVRQARLQQGAKDEEGEKATKKKEKKGKGFFRNLFKKKKKQEEEEVKPEEEELQPKPTDEEEFDFIDEETSGKEPEVKQEEVKEKKGLFGRKKDRKKKEPKKEEEPKQEEKAPEQDEPVTDPEEKKIPEKVDEDGF